MRDIVLILRREFLERVRSRAFLLGTFALPLLGLGLFALPILVAMLTTSERHLAVVDESPAPIGERFVEKLSAKADDEKGNRFHLERVAGSYADLRSTLVERTEREEIDGYIVLPADVLDGGPVIYRAQSVGGERVVGDIRRAATEAVQAERLEKAGLQMTDVAALMRNVDVDDATLLAGGEEGRGAWGTFAFAYFVSILIYFMTAIYGTSVLRSVLEEKSSRIAEVMVSSVKASHLMLGKVLGVGSAVLLQVAIWAVCISFIVVQWDVLERRFDIPPEVLASLHVPTSQFVLFILYFALGFLLFAALFAAAGAALSSEQEAQSVQFSLIVPLFLPLILSFQITAEPRSALATALSLFPLSAPIAMPMRIASTPIPPLEIAASLVLLALGLFAAAWLGGKVFRIGILSTGKKPSLAELWRWLREA